MELTKFCPRCGKETEKLFGEEKKLCPNCYPEKNDLLEIPGIVEITVCSICGRMRKHGEWIEEYSLEDQLGARFEEFSEEEVEMQLQYWEEDEKMFVRVHALRGEMKDEYDTELRTSTEQCEECSRFEGGFYKVKIQLRGEKDLEKVSNKMVDRAAEVTDEDRGSFISNIEENEHGFNFFLSTTNIAEELVSEVKKTHQPEVKRSYELVGEQDGQEVYRNVISVRLEE